MVAVVVVVGVVVVVVVVVVVGVGAQVMMKQHREEIKAARAFIVHSVRLNVAPRPVGPG